MNGLEGCSRTGLSDVVALPWMSSEHRRLRLRSTTYLVGTGVLHIADLEAMNGMAISDVRATRMVEQK